MPRASGQKYHYMDHDTDIVDELPPVQNTWYEVFHAQDVRLIWCSVHQKNDDIVAKDLEVRWTVNGNVYFESWSLEDDTWSFIYRTQYPSVGGTGGLLQDTVRRTAAYATDKRGLDFKVEVRMTSVPGTNQRLLCYCVRETLELT